MQQLTGMEASFLAFETPTSVGHVSGVLVVDPSTSPEPWDFDRVRRHLAARVARVPIMTRRLAEVPLGLDRPYWVADRQFDLDYHLRRVALPAGGGREALAELVERLHGRPLDRRRPLWETYVVEGLPEGRAALVTKVHHCCLDGVSAVEVLGALVDLDPAAPVPPEAPPITPAGGDPDRRLALGRAAFRMATTPVRVAKAGLSVGRALPVLGSMFGRSGPLARGDESIVELLGQRGAAPRTPFNASIGPHRRFAYASVPLADAKAVRASSGATVNDVVLAVVSGVLRRWLADHGGTPDRPLVAMVPVSVRSAEQARMIGNYVTSAACTLATHLADPLARLRAISAAMRVVKEEHGALPAALLTELTQMTPPAVAALLARTMAAAHLGDRLGMPYNLVVSNVPGPHVPLYLAGARVESHYPLSVLIEGSGLNVTVMSIDGMLDFGFVADRDLVPDLWSMADAVRPVLDELLVAAAPGGVA